MTVEISFDQGKLDQYGLSFDKVRGILGRDGYWRGLAVRFVVDKGRIVVSGKLPVDYQSRLGGTLIGAVGKTARPVAFKRRRTSASPEFVIADAKQDEVSSEGSSVLDPGDAEKSWQHACAWSWLPESLRRSKNVTSRPMSC